MPPTSIETPRVLLRKPERDDAQRIFTTYAQDPDVVRFLPWKPHATPAVSARFVGRCLALWNDGSASTWVLIMRDSGALMGMLEARIRMHAVEVGYVLGQPFWGRGLMRESLQAFVDWASNQPSLFRIWATCDVENVRSARLLERVGLQHEGILRRYLVHPNISTEPRDCHSYSKVQGTF
jgi:[ribosomal protein S5]-alanine N-acetyltransferase